MICDISKLSESYKNIPLVIKLGAYRRKYMMCGLSTKNSFKVQKGRDILRALNIYKTTMAPD